MKKINEMLRKNFVFALLAICIAAGAAFAEENPAKAGEAAVKVDSGATGTTPPVEMKAVELPKGVSHLRFKGGLLELKAEGAELIEVLKSISDETGIALDYPGDLQGKVSVDVRGSWLQDGIRKVLEAAKVNDYAFNFNDSKETRLYRITLLKGGTENADKGTSIAQKPANYPEPGLKRNWTSDEAKAYFQSKYGKGVSAGGGDRFSYPFGGLRWALPEWIKIETQEDALAFAQAFIADNPEAFQLGMGELRPDLSGWLGQYPSIRFELFYKGIPVENWFVAFKFMMEERGIHVVNNIGPALDHATEIKITAEDALAIAKEDFKVRKETLKRRSPGNEGEFSPKLVIVSEINSEPQLDWKFVYYGFYYYIDAIDGKIKRVFDGYSY